MKQQTGHFESAQQNVSQLGPFQKPNDLQDLGGNSYWLVILRYNNNNIKSKSISDQAIPKHQQAPVHPQQI